MTIHGIVCTAGIYQKMSRFAEMAVVVVGMAIMWTECFALMNGGWKWNCASLAYRHLATNTSAETGMGMRPSTCNLIIKMETLLAIIVASLNTFLVTFEFYTSTAFDRREHESRTRTASIPHYHIMIHVDESFPFNRRLSQPKRFALTTVVALRIYGKIMVIIQLIGIVSCYLVGLYRGQYVVVKPSIVAVSGVNMSVLTYYTGVGILSVGYWLFLRFRDVIRQRRYRDSPLVYGNGIHA